MIIAAGYGVPQINKLCRKFNEMLTLKNFEKQVSETILKRGKKYYDDGAVSSIAETEENEWQVTVDGSETYSVEVTLKNTTISDYFCDCPYDGDTCKHAVAAFFALRDAMDKHKKDRPGASPKNVFENVLQKISLKEYQDFTRQYALKNKEFRTQFELWFADKDERIDVSKKYADLLKKIIKSHTERGYIDYQASKSLSRDVGKLLDTGYEFVKKRNYTDAFTLAKPVIQELMEVITYTDDSSGSIGSVFSKTVQLIKAIAGAKDTALQLKEQVFDFLQSELNSKQYFDYGDYGDELFDIFQQLAGELNREKAFLAYIDAQLSKLTGKYDSYRKDFFITTKIEFLEALGRTGEVEKVIQQNMDVVAVREGEVNKAIDQKNFILAKRLISEGITTARKNEHPGIVSAWEKALLHIAVLEKDKETVRHYAKHFAFDRGFDKEYYSQWKKTYPAAEWKEVIEAYIQQEIKKVANENNQRKGKGWYTSNSDLIYSLAPVYIQEQYWDRLLALVQKENNLRVLLQFHDHLAKRYPSELLNMYLPAFKQQGDKVGARNEYADLAQKMKKVIKDIPDGKEKIIALAEQLKQKMPRRPAMIEELNKIL